MAKDRVTSDSYKFVIQPDRVPRGEYERQFNAPTINEIAAVVVSSERIALFRRTMVGLLELQSLINFMMLSSTR
ncbi:hypothetical protein TNCV_2015231 [Trichonephila clavipes]|nr:hypothetical protein TNCV_2015231 [Trichonephila clavipes]